MGGQKASPMGGGSSQSEAAEPSVEGWGGQKASPMGGGLEGAPSPLTTHHSPLRCT